MFSDWDKILTTVVVRIEVFSTIENIEGFIENLLFKSTESLWLGGEIEKLVNIFVYLHPDGNWLKYLLEWGREAC